MPYRLLADLVVAHPYFLNGNLAEAEILPDAATAARLTGLRMILRPVFGGVALYVELGDDGKPRLAIPDPTPLRFSLRRPAASIVAVTDLSAIGPGTVFSDAGVPDGQPLKAVVRPSRATEMITKADGSQTLTLAGSPAPSVTKADFVLAGPAGVTVTAYDAPSKRLTLAGPATALTVDYPVPPPKRPDVLADIEISIGPDTAAKAAAGNPRHLTIALAPVAARWVYHVVTDLTQPVGDWRVQAGNGGGPAPSFSDAGRAELAAGAVDDPFGADLVKRFSPLRVLRFLSDAPVPARERPARQVSLSAGQQQLFTGLPAPPPTALRMIGGQAAFGAVIQFVTM